MNFIKENIVNHVKIYLIQLLNSENKIHYPHFENSEIGRRPHKKSLSDCGDLNFNFEEEKHFYYDGS